MGIEYEVDITSTGNELNIESITNELTLSRTGAQGPGGAATATPFDPNGQFTSGEITFTADFVFFTAVRDIAADSDVSVLNTTDFRPLINIDDAVIAQAIAEYLANNPLEVVVVASSTPQEVPALEFVLAGTDLYLATTSHSNVTLSTDFTVAGWYHVNGTGVERLATDPTSPTEGEVWFNTTSDELKYYDGTNTDVVADTKDLATFEDRTLDTPVEYRLDEIEYDTLQDGHQHEFLFKFENDLGQIGEKAISTQAPIADGRPATNANFTDDTDTQRYTTVATVKHWANNEFVEDTQVLTSTDPDTASTNTNIVSAGWLKAQWAPTKTPATGTVPASWDNIGDDVTVTGDSGENIVGITVTDGTLVSVERGTIEAGDATVFSATRPTNPEANDRWVDLTTGRQYVWTVGTNASYWRQLSGLAQAAAGEALDLTATEVEAFFTDGSGDRAVTYTVANNEITTTVAADSSKQDNITLTAGTSGATFLNNVLDLSSLTPGDVTATTVADLFNDSSASRGVSYSATSNNKIDTVVNADTSKQDTITLTAGTSGATFLNNVLDLSSVVPGVVTSVTVGSSGATFTNGALNLSGITGGSGGGGGLPNYSLPTIGMVEETSPGASSTYTITHPNPGTAVRFNISLQNTSGSSHVEITGDTTGNIQSALMTGYAFDSGAAPGWWSWNSGDTVWQKGFVGNGTLATQTRIAVDEGGRIASIDMIATGNLSFTDTGHNGSTRIQWFQAS